MSTEEQLRWADEMLASGQSDEEAERRTGVSLLEIIGLRAGAAAFVGPRRPSHEAQVAAEP